MTVAIASAPRSAWHALETAPFGEVDRFLVPTDAPPVIAYFLDHLFVAHTVRERLTRPLHRLTGGRFLFRRPATPNNGLVGVADLGHGLENAHRVLAELFETDGWALLRRASIDPTNDGRWIVLQDYPTSSRQRLVLFLFDQRRRGLTAVLKLGLTSQTNRPEHEAIQAVRGRLPQLLRASVPEPLAFARASGFEALLLSGLPGRSAYVELHTRFAPRWLVASHLQQAAVWLAHFHEATRSQTGVFKPERSRSALLRALTEQEMDAGDSGWMDSLCESCCRSPLPLASSHGDFWARNVLVGVNPPNTSNGGLPGVVDWECFQEEAPPFEDLFHFPLTYGLNYPWSRYSRTSAGTAFSQTFLEGNHVSREVRRYFHRYCALGGLDPQLLGPLFRLYLLGRAASAYRTQDDRCRQDRRFWLRCLRTLVESDQSVFSG